MSDVVARRVAASISRSAAPDAVRYFASTVGRHNPAAQQRRQPASDAALTELGKRERHIAIVPGDGAAYAKGAIECFVDQARQFGVVGNGESRVEVGLERKFPQQRQAERVDRADGNIGGAIAQLAPPRRRNIAGRRRRAESRHDALAHLRCGLPGKCDRQNVGWVNPRPQQIDIAVDQHARLPGSRRRLQGNVESRIDGAGARQVVVTRLQRSPFCTPRDTHSSCRSAVRTAVAETRRARLHRRCLRRGCGQHRGPGPLRPTRA